MMQSELATEFIKRLKEKGIDAIAAVVITDDGGVVGFVDTAAKESALQKCMETNGIDIDEIFDAKDMLVQTIEQNFQESIIDDFWDGVRTD